MTIERVSITKKGEEMKKGEKNEGWGEGKTLWQLKGFWLPHKCGDQNLSVTTLLW
jgi:hypothetical protein